MTSSVAPELYTSHLHFLQGNREIYGPAHDIFILNAITYNVQKPSVNVHVDISSGARGLDFGLSLHLYTVKPV